MGGKQNELGSMNSGGGQLYGGQGGLDMDQGDHKEATLSSEHQVDSTEQTNKNKL